jgi:hypothetical protein
MHRKQLRRKKESVLLFELAEKLIKKYGKFHPAASIAMP